MIQWLKTFFKLLFTPKKVEIEPVVITKRDLFIKIINEALNTEVTPKDDIPDDVACAETMSTLLKRVFPDFPILPLTTDLDYKLLTDKDFQTLGEPEVGCIVISPKKNGIYGHVGAFVDENNIASNDSRTGLFAVNYTWNSWIKNFKDKKGLRIYLYKIVV